MDGPGMIAVGNFDWFAILADAALTLPGSLRAVDFDQGGEGVAYHDSSPGNSGGALRASDVDIEVSAEGGHNVGWVADGEWLRYTVLVDASGTYLLSFRVASPLSNGRLHVEAGDVDVTGPVAVPNTGGWQAWTTVSVPAHLTAGRQTLRIAFDIGGFNLHRVDIVDR